jgi:hypothetical protein
MPNLYIWFDGLGNKVWYGEKFFMVRNVFLEIRFGGLSINGEKILKDRNVFLGNVV